MLLQELLTSYRIASPPVRQDDLVLFAHASSTTTQNFPAYHRATRFAYLDFGHELDVDSLRVLLAQPGVESDLPVDTDTLASFTISLRLVCVDTARTRRESLVDRFVDQLALGVAAVVKTVDERGGREPRQVSTAAREELFPGTDEMGVRHDALQRPIAYTLKPDVGFFSAGGPFVAVGENKSPHASWLGNAEQREPGSFVRLHRALSELEGRYFGLSELTADCRSVLEQLVAAAAQAQAPLGFFYDAFSAFYLLADWTTGSVVISHLHHSFGPDAPSLPRIIAASFYSSSRRVTATSLLAGLCELTDPRSLPLTPLCDAGSHGGVGAASSSVLSRGPGADLTGAVLGKGRPSLADLAELPRLTLTYPSGILPAQPHYSRLSSFLPSSSSPSSPSTSPSTHSDAPARAVQTATPPHTPPQLNKSSTSNSSKLAIRPDFLIGSGRSSNVYRGRTASGEFYVLKESKPGQATGLLREAAILRNLMDSRLAPRLLGAFGNGEQVLLALTDEGHDLGGAASLSREVRLKILASLATLHILYQVRHADPHLGNVLRRPDGDIRLCDFEGAETGHVCDGLGCDELQRVRAQVGLEPGVLEEILAELS